MCASCATILDRIQQALEQVPLAQRAYVSTELLNEAIREIARSDAGEALRVAGRVPDSG